MKRFIIRDIITKKIKRLNSRVLEFTSITSARDYLVWMPFNLGNYYEVYDNLKQKVTYSFSDNIHKRVKRK